MAVSDWSQTAASNTSVGSVNVNEGCPPGNLNDAIREMMAQIAAWYSTVTSLGASLMSASDAAAARSAITAAQAGANTDITSLQDGCAAATQSANDNSTKLATTAYADAIGAKAIGYGQTWQDVTSSRNVGTPYTNSTGKGITVVITCLNSTSATLTLDGVSFPICNSPGSFYSYSSLTVLVPAGSTYTLSSGSNKIQWNELR